MKTSLTIALLAGALAASAGLNAYQAVRLRTTESAAIYGMTRAAASAPCGSCATGTAGVTQPACRLAEQLGLTAAQRERIVGCGAGRCGREEEQRERLAQRSAELQAALNCEVLDGPRVQALVDEVAALRTAEWKACIDCVVQVRSVLTREQVVRLVAQAGQP